MQNVESFIETWLMCTGSHRHSFHCTVRLLTQLQFVSSAERRRVVSLHWLCALLLWILLRNIDAHTIFFFFGTLTKPVTALDPLLLSSSSSQDRLSESENSAGCCFRACESRCCWPIVKFGNEDVAPFFLFIYLFIYIF